MKNIPMIVSFQAKTGELEFTDNAIVLVHPDNLTQADPSSDAEQNALRERAVDVFIERFKWIFPNSELISATAGHTFMDYSQVPQEA